MQNRIFLLVFLILPIMSCKTTKNRVESGLETKVIELYKSPCFGECPVFYLSIFDNHIARLDARHNMDIAGIYTKQLDNKEYKALVKSFREANIWKYPDVFPSDIVDFPTTKLYFHDEGREKQIEGKYDWPEELKTLEELLMKIVREDNWIALETENIQKDSIENRIEELSKLPDTKDIIVQLLPKSDVSYILEDYARFGLEIKKRIVPGKPLWLFSYDPAKVETDRILQILKSDRRIVVAEWDKETTPRSN